MEYFRYLQMIITPNNQYDQKNWSFRIDQTITTNTSQPNEII